MKRSGSWYWLVDENVYNANNQVNGGSFDGAGNQLVIGGDTFIYDTENRQTAVIESQQLGAG